MDGQKGGNGMARRRKAKRSAHSIFQSTIRLYGSSHRKRWGHRLRPRTSRSIRKRLRLGHNCKLSNPQGGRDDAPLRESTVRSNNELGDLPPFPPIGYSRTPGRSSSHAPQKPSSTAESHQEHDVPKGQSMRGPLFPFLTFGACPPQADISSRLPSVELMSSPPSPPIPPHVTQARDTQCSLWQPRIHSWRHHSRSRPHSGSARPTTSTHAVVFGDVYAEGKPDVRIGGVKDSSIKRPGVER
ncbi:unnamed protein product [Somion occarium]